METPCVVNIRSPKNRLNVAIVTTMEIISKK